MKIKTLHIKNFKSFKDTKIELSNTNYLIGPNGSGKSNFIEVFKFLRDISRYGLENAISIQGGVEYLKNLESAPHEPLSINVIIDVNRYPINVAKKKKIGLAAEKINYLFELSFEPSKEKKYSITKETLNIDCCFVELKRKKKTLRENKTLGEGHLAFKRNDKGRFDEPNFKKKPKDIVFDKTDIPFRQIEFEDIGMDEKPSPLLLEDPVFGFYYGLKYVFGDIKVFDIDSKLPKKSSMISGKVELEEDGGNLAIVLKEIFANEGEKKKFIHLLNDLLPFIKKIKTQQMLDKSIMFEVQEEFYEKGFIPSALLSDGTINLIAFIVAVYFDRAHFKVIEEPEKNIHPFLISKIINMINDVGEKFQIIVTSHSSETLKSVMLDNIILVKRERGGHSQLIKPAQKVEIKEFLKNDLGIDDLFIQNLL